MSETIIIVLPEKYKMYFPSPHLFVSIVVSLNVSNYRHLSITQSKYLELDDAAAWIPALSLWMHLCRCGEAATEINCNLPPLWSPRNWLFPPPCSPTLPEQHWWSYLPHCKLPAVPGRTGRLWISVSYKPVNNEQIWSFLVMVHRI